MKLVITCEHGGREIPKSYQYLFKEAGTVLDTHRGYDPGALDLYTHLARLSNFSQACTISRLLIEVNRSLHHPQLFSEFTAELPLAEKKKIIDNYYLPYRGKIEKQILNIISGGERVVHISVHSFTPVLNGDVRAADIGILYDPARIEEKEIAKDFKSVLLEQLPQTRVRFNYPYLGKADGFTTSLRNKFPKNYSGIELEVNQKFSNANKMDKKIREILYSCISDLKKSSSSKQ